MSEYAIRNNNNKKKGGGGAKTLSAAGCIVTTCVRSLRQLMSRLVHKKGVESRPVYFEESSITTCSSLRQVHHDLCSFSQVGNVN